MAKSRILFFEGCSYLCQLEMRLGVDLYLRAEHHYPLGALRL